jgi:23S rRNA (guanine745-N1)-methyltransferase
MPGVKAPPLACTVRGCGQPLIRHAGTMVCTRRHSYDVARSGYVNLLQPQDRRAPEAGDARPAVEARATLEQAGVGGALVDAVVRRLSVLALPRPTVVVDLGSGTGRALAAVAAAREVAGVGIDLSVAAVEYAARHWDGLTWVVANADRTLPLLDGSVDLVLSLHARRNPPEVARVLKPEGVFLAAVPAPDDLIELRTQVQGAGVTRDRLPSLVAEHRAGFAVEDTFRVDERLRLEPQQLRALLNATYRGVRRSAEAQVTALTALEVTLAADVCVLRRRGAESQIEIEN